MEKFDFSNKLEAVTGEVQGIRTNTFFCNTFYLFIYFQEGRKKKRFERKPGSKNVRAETRGKKIKTESEANKGDSAAAKVFTRRLLTTLGKY